jgi:hypothetical protein
MPAISATKGARKAENTNAASIISSISFRAICLLGQPGWLRSDDVESNRDATPSAAIRSSRKGYFIVLNQRFVYAA